MFKGFINCVYCMLVFGGQINDKINRSFLEWRRKHWKGKKLFNADMINAFKLFNEAK